MKAYKVSGSFMMGDVWQSFTKEVVGESEEEVMEVIYSRLGSKHRVKRAKIQISEVAEIPPGELTDPITKSLFEGAKRAEKKKG
jgi:large subunit ribosomal protein LX